MGTMTRIVFRKAAREEFDEAADWYERQRYGLGDIFTQAIQQRIQHIAAQPTQHAVVLRDIRKSVVKGFPYCIYYRVKGSDLIVLSVFHTSRNPIIWQRRS